MRRALALAASAALIIIGGCGFGSYEKRLEMTIEDMKYQDRLNRLLTAPLKGKFEEMSIYLRPPKNLAQTKEWMLAPVEEGKFDLDASFLEPQKQSMHVLVRIKQPKSAGKKGAAPKVDTANRANFNADVFAVLNEFYKPPEDLSPTKVKSETKRANDYKFQTITVGDKNVQIYLYKHEPYDVALIFEYPKSQQADVFSKIGLCLESLAVGEKARRYFAGATTEEEATQQTGAAGPPI